MSQVIPEKYRDLFQKRAFASLGTLMPDGRPQVTPVWCDFDGEHVIFNSAKGRQKDRNVRRDPRVSLAIDRSRKSLSLSRNSRPRRRDHRRRRRRPHQQAGEEISGRRQISIRAAQRNSRHLQDQARAHHGDGIEFVSVACTSVVEVMSAPLPESCEGVSGIKHAGSTVAANREDGASARVSSSRLAGKP